MRNELRKLSVRLLMALALCIIGGLFMGPVKAEAATKAKVVLEFTDGTKKTWNTGDEPISISKKELAYVYFGEYPQTEITGKKLTKAIKNAKYDKNGIATVKGVKYKRLKREEATFLFDSTIMDDSFYKKHFYDWAGKDYVYFTLEPIKWRVLSTNNRIAFLLSEYGLDDQKYNFEKVDINWADCTLRSWLNADFLTSAFNAKERKLIKNTSVKNYDYPYNKTDEGKNTKDKIYLLSMNDAVNSKYGFDSNKRTYDINRRCSTTDYAKVTISM